MNGTVIASLIGIVATTQIHIAKGLQRYGIEGLRSASTGTVEKRGRRRILYITGVVLNNAAFLWALLANLYAPTAYFTATFGFGLVVMMLFSGFILREPITKFQYIGAAVIAAGTVLIGGGRGGAEVPPMHAVILDRAVFFTSAYFILLLLLIAIFLRYKRQTGVIFGLFTGGAAAFDPIFKGVGQQFGETMKILPHSPEGWLFFGGSFLFGFLAFSFTQIGFYKHAKATTLVAFHNAALMIVPIIFMKLALPGFGLSRLQVVGLVTVLLGISLMFGSHTCVRLHRMAGKLSSFLGI
ncbi:MAG: hypothetical protein ACLFMZ_04325 [Spirochaetaceae bacterium]